MRKRNIDLMEELTKDIEALADDMKRANAFKLFPIFISIILERVYGEDVIDGLGDITKIVLRRGSHD